MTAVSIFPPVVAGTKRAARLNARVARRLGWKRDAVQVLTSDDYFTVLVGGRDFDIFGDKKLVKILSKQLDIRVKNKVVKNVGVMHSVRVSGSNESDFCEDPREALVRAILATPRRQLRSFF